MCKIRSVSMDLIPAIYSPSVNNQLSIYLIQLSVYLSRYLYWPSTLILAITNPQIIFSLSTHLLPLETA